MRMIYLFYAIMYIYECIWYENEDSKMPWNVLNVY